MVASVLLCGHRSLEVFCRTLTLGKSQMESDCNILIIKQR
jgi:hypothetical protein